MLPDEIFKLIEYKSARCCLTCDWYGYEGDHCCFLAQSLVKEKCDKDYKNVQLYIGSDKICKFYKGE